MNSLSPTHSVSRYLRLLAPGSLVVLILCGCGGNELGTVPVEGVVRVENKTLTTGSVRFVPDTSKGNTGKYEPVGQIGPDGKYKLQTQGHAGAPPGWYKVAVVSMDEPDSTKPLATKSHIGANYGDPEKSGIRIEVTSSPAPGAYDIVVTAK